MKSQSIHWHFILLQWSAPLLVEPSSVLHFFPNSTKFIISPHNGKNILSDSCFVLLTVQEVPQLLMFSFKASVPYGPTLQSFKDRILSNIGCEESMEAHMTTYVQLYHNANAIAYVLQGCNQVRSNLCAMMSSPACCDFHIIIIMASCVGLSSVKLDPWPPLLILQDLIVQNMYLPVEHRRNLKEFQKYFP